MPARVKKGIKGFLGIVEPVSGRFATAKPHRIKAAHRRRRKAASGQSVQRYYDPDSGRFLSVDPVTALSNPVTNFNRYVYALNNPHKFTDPDGRYWCSGGKAQCATVENYVAGIRKSLGYLRPGTAEYIRVSNVVERLGKPWTLNGTTVNPTVLPKNELANAGRGGIINIDLAQTSAYAKNIAAANPNVAPSDSRTAAGAGVIAHETRHQIQAGKDGQLPASRSEEFKSEIQAFTTESAVAKGLGINVGLSTPKDIQAAANQTADAWCKKGGSC